MELKLNCKRDSCRSGELLIDRAQYETPMCFMYTRSGTIPHIAIWHDLLEHNLPVAVQLTLPTLVDQASTELTKQLENGIHSFIGRKVISFLSIQDPAVEPPVGYNEDKAVSVWAAGGRRKIDVQQFISTMEAFRPNIVECLCDTIPSSGQSPKRIKKSVDRTLKFLDEIIEHNEENKQLKCHILGAIEGSDSINERLRSAKETAKHPVSGFVLEGFNGCSNDWVNLLAKTVSELPENKPRFIHGISTPDDVIKAVECGIDVFDSSFPYQVTERGCALIFPSQNKRFKPDLNFTAKDNDANTKSNVSGSPPKEEEDKARSRDGSEYEIDLNDVRFSNDLSSVDHCGCYCCTSHSRAYIHHLLVTKEMLAKVLLMTHNLHQYYRFFENIRQAINNDCWENFKERFHVSWNR